MVPKSLLRTKQYFYITFAMDSLKTQNKKSSEVPALHKFHLPLNFYNLKNSN